jgi:hypothetical protein
MFADHAIALLGRTYFPPTKLRKELFNHAKARMSLMWLMYGPYAADNVYTYADDIMYIDLFSDYNLLMNDSISLINDKYAHIKSDQKLISADSIISLRYVPNPKYIEGDVELMDTFSNLMRNPNITEGALVSYICEIYSREIIHGKPFNRSYDITFNKPDIILDIISEYIHNRFSKNPNRGNALFWLDLILRHDHQNIRDYAMCYATEQGIVWQPFKHLYRKIMAAFKADVPKHMICAAFEFLLYGYPHLRFTPPYGTLQTMPSEICNKDHIYTFISSQISEDQFKYCENPQTPADKDLLAAMDRCAKYIFMRVIRYLFNLPIGAVEFSFVLPPFKPFNDVIDKQYLIDWQDSPTVDDQYAYDFMGLSFQNILPRESWSTEMWYLHYLCYGINDFGALFNFDEFAVKLNECIEKIYK